jgi:hypothetical protein
MRSRPSAVLLFGVVHPEYAAIRISFGFPPGDVPAAR